MDMQRRHLSLTFSNSTYNNSLYYFTAEQQKRNNSTSLSEEDKQLTIKMNALITLILSLLAIGHATARLEGSADSFHRILAPPFCGDNDCKGSETCESCPEDCGCATGETCAPGGSCVSGCTDECCDDSQCDDGNGCTLDQ